MPITLTGRLLKEQGAYSDLKLVSDRPRDLTAFALLWFENTAAFRRFKENLVYTKQQAESTLRV